MFINKSHLILDNPNQLNFGCCVTDFDNDGQFEIIVAGFGYKNLVLKWKDDSFINIAPHVFEDADQKAISVASGDLNGDGREEIYIVNSDTFGGRKRFADRLFVYKDEWMDIFESEEKHLKNLFSARSVAVIDRKGFFVVNYGGPMKLFELENGKLVDNALEAGLNITTGGRSVLSAPILSKKMDLYLGTDNGPNLFFKNGGDGVFEECSKQLNLDDSFENARGLSLVDQDGQLGIVCGNWEGPHRLFVREDGTFRDISCRAMITPSKIRNIISADFDNDGYEEIFFNNYGQPNKLFGWRNGKWTILDIGDAMEPQMFGTGCCIGDFDNDGRLELLISHGGDVEQRLSLFHTNQNNNHWLRIFPKTMYGAPARGAIVKIFMNNGRIQIRIIDAGSGYLCQQEPVAHFGLGKEKFVQKISVLWPDEKSKVIEGPVQCDQVLIIDHPLASSKKRKRINEEKISKKLKLNDNSTQLYNK